jgi:sodium-dependent dicarboxylate transporter 2/3/5
MPDRSSSSRGGSSVRRAGLAAGPLLFLVALALPLPDIGDFTAGFSVNVTLGLALWMAAWWMTEALPLAATSLLPLIVLPVSGVLPATAVAPQYFSDIVALFLGGFCLALAMQKAELHHRIALRVLHVFGAKPRRLVLGFLVASALLSMWVSNTATTLLLLPVVLTVVNAALPAERSDAASRFAAACMLAVAFGASIGGVGTTIGTPPNAFLQGFFNQRYAVEIAEGSLREVTFGRWMLVGLPVVLAVVPLCWLLLTRISPRVPAHLPEFSTQAAAGVKAATWPSRAEWLVMAVFFSTAAAWITHAPIRIGTAVVPLTGWDQWFTFGGAGSYITDGTIAISAAVLLFVLPGLRGERLLTWDFAAPRLPWGALLLFGGGLALAHSFDAGGLSEYLKAAFGTLGGAPLWLLVLIVIILVAALSELASNTAAAAMVVPVLASLSAAMGFEPMPLLMAAVLGASCGYALPVATPPNTIVYATGEISVGRMVRAGAMLDVIVAIVMFAAVMLLVRTLF